MPRTDHPEAAAGPAAQGPVPGEPAPERAGRARGLASRAIRRIAWAVPTLLGISLLTFSLIHLTPGEPGAGGAGLRQSPVTAEAAENLRRTYGLDLPLFLNISVQDRGRRVRRALDQLSAPRTAPQAERRLEAAGILAFPELAEALARTSDPAVRLRLRRVADQTLSSLGVEARESLAKGPPGGYLAWWRGRRADFRPQAIRRQVGRLARGEPGSVTGVRRMGKRAVPALMEQLLSTGDPSARERLSRALAAATSHVVIYDVAAPPRERRSAMGQWADWWRAEETVYRDLSGWERLGAAFTRTQYARWLGRLVRGDFGESLYYRQRAWDVIAERLPVTLGLNLAALVLAYLLAVPMGVWAATRRGQWPDRLLSAGLLLLYSLPAYWVALVLVLFLGGIEGPALFPTGGLHSFHPASYPAGSALLDLLWHAVLPVFCLGYGALAVVSRYQRAGMLAVLDQDYIRTARAKGLPERRVVWSHGLRNGLIPVVNLLGLQIPYLLSGSVIVETIFDIPGLGSLTLVAIHQRDTNVLMGIVSLTALLTLVGLLVSDLLMLWADPRISLESREAP